MHSISFLNGSVITRKAENSLPQLQDRLELWQQKLSLRHDYPCGSMTWFGGDMMTSYHISGSLSSAYNPLPSLWTSPHVTASQVELPCFDFCTARTNVPTKYCAGITSVIGKQMIYFVSNNNFLIFFTKRKTPSQ